EITGGCGCRQTRGEVVAAADAQAFLVQRSCVVVAPREDGRLRDRGQMRCEQAADRARADDADFHANFALRYHRYGPGSRSEPVTRRSKSHGGYLLPWRYTCSRNHSRSDENSPREKA